MRRVQMRNLAIAIFTGVMVLCIALVCTLSALQDTKTAVGTITFTADVRVKGTITTKYILETREDNADWTTIQIKTENAGNDGVLDFDGDESDNQVFELQETDFVLTSKSRYVVYEVCFSSKAEAEAYTASLTYTDNTTNPNGGDKNIEMFYVTSNTAKAIINFTTYDNIKITFAGATPIVEGVATNQVEVAENGGSIYVYILAKVADLTKSAELSGDFGWSLKNKYFS